jgi:hypothetical protein
METIEYGGWPHCRRLSNGIVELIVTADVGPRVIRFGFEGERNEFKEYSATLGQTGGDEWKIYGGHRLWHAPEARPRTYFPDNAPVAVRETAHSALFTPPPETTTGIQKEIELLLQADAAHVEVRHRLTNHNLWPVELAPWALSVMEPGGTAILPLPPRGSHEEFLLPTSSIALPAYLDMSDPRWTWGEKYILLRAGANRSTPQKIGLHVSDEWCAYARDGHLFVKIFPYHDGAHYPDWNSSVEVFTNGEMLELETLGPLINLQPAETVEHIEHWHLFRDVPFAAGEADVERHVLPKILELS